MGASPHAFAVVRGRGYRPEQVDRRVARLIGRSSEDWERAARLTALVEQMTGEMERLRAEAESRPPQTYEALGDRARKLLVLAESESAQVLGAGRSEARLTVEQAEAAARVVRESAQREAKRLRAEATATAARTVENARAQADALRIAAQAASDEVRTAAEATLREVSRRCAESVAGQERAQEVAREEADRELAERERAFEAYVGELSERGERLLAVARRERAEAEEAARRWQEEASARGAELIAAARVREEGVERETGRELREHAERAEQMRRHMARVRSTLASLTGRAAEQEPAHEQDRDSAVGSLPWRDSERGEVVSLPGQMRGRVR